MISRAGLGGHTDILEQERRQRKSVSLASASNCWPGPIRQGGPHAGVNGRRYSGSATRKPLDTTGPVGAGGRAAGRLEADRQGCARREQPQRSGGRTLRLLAAGSSRPSEIGAAPAVGISQSSGTVAAGAGFGQRPGEQSAGVGRGPHDPERAAVRRRSARPRAAASAAAAADTITSRPKAAAVAGPAQPRQTPSRLHQGAAWLARCGTQRAPDLLPDLRARGDRRQILGQRREPRLPVGDAARRARDCPAGAVRPPRARRAAARPAHTRRPAGRDRPRPPSPPLQALPEPQQAAPDPALDRADRPVEQIRHLVVGQAALVGQERRSGAARAPADRGRPAARAGPPRPAEIGPADSSTASSRSSMPTTSRRWRRKWSSAALRAIGHQPAHGRAPGRVEACARGPRPADRRRAAPPRPARGGAAGAPARPSAGRWSGRRARPGRRCRPPPRRSATPPPHRRPARPRSILPSRPLRGRCGVAEPSTPVGADWMRR